MLMPAATRCSVLALLLTVALHAGPPLACFRYETEPGSLFEPVQALSMVALDSDDHPEAASTRIRQLRAAAKPDEVVSLVEAGYLIQAMNQMWNRDDPDGLAFLQKASALRPDDAEIHFLLALAYVGRDKPAALRHLERARALSKPGSAVRRNLVKAAPVLPS